MTSLQNRYTHMHSERNVTSRPRYPISSDTFLISVMAAWSVHFQLHVRGSTGSGVWTDAAGVAASVSVGTANCTVVPFAFKIDKRARAHVNACGPFSRVTPSGDTRTVIAPGDPQVTKFKSSCNARSGILVRQKKRDREISYNDWVNANDIDWDHRV